MTITILFRTKSKYLKYIQEYIYKKGMYPLLHFICTPAEADLDVMQFCSPTQVFDVP